MEEIISFLTTEELIIVYAVVGVILLITISTVIIKKMYKERKKKQNTRELNKLVSEVHERIEEDKTNMAVEESVKTETLEPVPEIIEEKKEDNMEIIEEIPIKIEPTMPEVKEVLTPTIELPNTTIIPQEEEVVEPPKEHVETSLLDQVEEIELLDDFDEVEVNEIEDKTDTSEQPQVEEIEYEEDMNQTKAQEEIEKLTKELVQASNTVENIDLTNFEEEQEKNAIISLDEFLKLGDELYDKNEVSQYEDEGNEPISLEDLEDRKNEAIYQMEEIEKEEAEPKAEQVKLKLDDFYSVKDNNAKFQTSPVISPVYGIEKTVSENDIEIENTANYEKLDEEIKKTNEFLSTLRELQEKLQ